MGTYANEVKCGVVEWLKSNIRTLLRWFGSTERINSEEFVKKNLLYVSEVEGPGRKGRPLKNLKDRVKAYICERGASRGGGIEQAKRKCLDRERWIRDYCCGHPLGRCSQRDRAVRERDRWIDRAPQISVCSKASSLRLEVWMENSEACRSRWYRAKKVSSQSVNIYITLAGHQIVCHFILPFIIAYNRAVFLWSLVARQH